MRPPVTPIRWDLRRLHLLDQRLLPHQELWIECVDAAATAEAIRSMVVRGAPAIGITAAYGLALEAIRHEGDPAIADRLHEAAAHLRASRPTAVNLGWALDRMLSLARRTELAELPNALSAEAEVIHRTDIEANRRIGALGASLLPATPTILTHCNAGALATGGYGTALGVVRAVAEGGRRIAVFAGETRPYLQGARLTAWELEKDGIDVTLITDGMAGHFFSLATFDAVVVGADRIAANGDTANKIGTYPLAVLANRHGIPFYVAAPVSTLDPATPDGSSIPIEERSEAEVVDMSGRDAEGTIRTVRIAAQGVNIRHPAFDITPAELITAIITDRGIARPPYQESLAALVSGS